MYEYEYNKVINPDNLHSQLINVPGFAGLTLSGTIVKILFTEELTTHNKAIVDKIVQLHNGELFNQKEKDTIRFMRRAASKDDILVSIASDNMERVRSGLWTISQLISLTQDPELKNLLDDISYLSFEIAYSKVDALTNALLTQDIKDVWKAKLAANFFIE